MKSGGVGYEKEGFIRSNDLGSYKLVDDAKARVRVRNYVFRGI